MAFFLDFEKKIQQLQEEIELGKVRKDLHAVEILEKELEKEVVKTYSFFKATKPDPTTAVNYFLICYS